MIHTLSTREEVSDAIDREPQSCFTEPGADEIPSLSIEIRQREAPHASLFGGADLCELHHRTP